MRKDDPVYAIETQRTSFKDRLAATWWQVGAGVIAAGAAVAAIGLIVDDPGPIWKRLIGCTLLMAACSLVVGGLLLRRRARDAGSTMVAAGITPGIAPVVFFWFPPAVAIGVFSIAVFVFAVNDAVDARRLHSRDRGAGSVVVGVADREA